jgi:hydrogenase maturation protease
VTGGAQTGGAQTRGTLTGKTLVAGIGNIFLSDDGFGVEVVSRLAQAGLPGSVRVADYGIRGMHLAYDLGGYDAAILIDAAPRGESPGTVYVIEPDLPPRARFDKAAAADQAGAESAPADGDEAAAALAASPFFDAHGMQPDVVFSMLGMLTDERPDRILVVGCEPASLEYGMGLSEPVAAAVDQAVEIVLGLLAGVPSSPGGAGHLLAHVSAEEGTDVPRHSG